MSQANAGLTPEQIKKNRDILNDHRIFIDAVQEITPEREYQIAEFLLKIDSEDAMPLPAIPAVDESKK